MGEKEDGGGYHRDDGESDGDGGSNGNELKKRRISKARRL